MILSWEIPLFSSAVHVLISRSDLVTSGAWRGIGGFLPGDVGCLSRTVWSVVQSPHGSLGDTYSPVKIPQNRVQEHSHALRDVYHHQLSVNGVSQVHLITRSLFSSWAYLLIHL